MSRRLGILISGRGSNLQSIIDAIAHGELTATIAVVVSNQPEAAGLMRAREAGIEAVCLTPRKFDTGTPTMPRSPTCSARARSISCAWPASCGWWARRCCRRFPTAMLNIHPSLLPAFPGLEAQRQAIEHGVRVAGATVHLVTEELDGGPIVAQAAVPVQPGDSAEMLSARILVEEHRLYPQAIAKVLDGSWRIEGRRFVIDRVDAAVGLSNA